MANGKAILQNNPHEKGDAEGSLRDAIEIVSGHTPSSQGRIGIGASGQLSRRGAKGINWRLREENLASPHVNPRPHDIAGVEFRTVWLVVGCCELTPVVAVVSIAVWLPPGHTSGLGSAEDIGQQGSGE